MLGTGSPLSPDTLLEVSRATLGNKHKGIYSGDRAEIDRLSALMLLLVRVVAASQAASDWSVSRAALL